jgi:hypothetical protein
MADLSKAGEAYNPDEVFDVELTGLDGAPLFNDDGTAMTIGVIGQDSEFAVAERKKNSNRILQQNGRVKRTAEGIEGENTAYLAKLSKRWNITMGGEKPEFSFEAVRALYADPKFSFIREQVDAAIGERANFLKASS